MPPTVTTRFVAVFSLVLFTPTRKQVVYGVHYEKCDDCFTECGQPRKTKPEVAHQLTLLDIIANGTAIRLFKETVVSEDTRTRYVMSIRRPSGRGWMAKQIIWPAGKLEQALLEANKVAQQEIQRVSLLATA